MLSSQEFFHTDSELFEQVPYLLAIPFDSHVTVLILCPYFVFELRLILRQPRSYGNVDTTLYAAGLTVPLVCKWQWLTGLVCLSFLAASDVCFGRATTN